MNSEIIKSKIKGCIIGAAVGDAVGGPFELQDYNSVKERLENDWIDTLYDYHGNGNPHGCWLKNAPPGAGTDDTRYNQIYLNLAIELCHPPSAFEIAKRFLEIYENPTKFYPEHAGLAKQQFKVWHGVCSGLLGKTSELFPGIPPSVLRERSIGLNYPTLIGLITLTSSGLFFRETPEQAYKYAFEADFFDVGYAKEAVALLAAIMSQGFMDSVNVKEIFTDVCQMDPLSLGGVFGGPVVKERLLSHLDICKTAGTEKELIKLMSSIFRSYNLFDPLLALSIAILALSYAESDPLRAILTAANYKALSDSGEFVRFGDIDCYAHITGAIGGLFWGIDALPKNIVQEVILRNKEVYKINLTNLSEKVADNLT